MRSEVRTWQWGLAIVLVGALAPRCWLAPQLVTPARDGMKYIRAGETIRDNSWSTAIATLECHPLYPLLLNGARVGIEAVTDLRGARAWITAGQAVGVGSHIVMLSVVYVLGVRWFRVLPTTIGCLLASWLPRQMQYSIDVLADPLHACCWWVSILFVTLALERRRLPFALLASLTAGAGYLTRPESLLLPVGFAIAAMLMATRRLTFADRDGRTQTESRTQRSGVSCNGTDNSRRSSPSVVGHLLRWRCVRGSDWILLMLGLTVPFALIVGGYAMQRGSLTPRNSLRGMTGAATIAEINHDESVRNTDPTGLLNSLGRLGYEVCRSTRVMVLLLALIGLWASRSRWSSQMLPLLIVTLLSFVGLTVLAAKTEVPSARYLTPTVYVLGLLAGVGVTHVSQTRSTLAWPRLLTVLLIAGTVNLSGWTTHLHASRSPLVDAADWLRSHTPSHEVVYDPDAFGAFLADRNVWLPTAAWPEALPIRYALIDTAHQSHLPMLHRDLITRIGDEGVVAARFTGRRKTDELIIYELPHRSQNANPIRAN